VTPRKPNLRERAWLMFDRLVQRAAAPGYTNPWVRNSDGEVEYEPDYSTLQKLLGVPLLLRAQSRSGVPALALDVWTAYELRRAGFGPDAVWPRASTPRILPSTLVQMLSEGTRADVAAITKMIASGKTYGGAITASANILGKNYVKQVDVVISSWNTGPELMISTKRMDSSFGKNAANRVEESYGDAKNLRSRYPQAALGFLYSLRSTALTEESAITRWLIDLLAKLGREDDAYDAVTLLIPEWSSDLDVEGAAEEGSGDDDPEDRLAAAGLAEDPHAVDEPTELPDIPADELDAQLATLPVVHLRRDDVPPMLRPERFFAVMIGRVLDNSPITFHELAREQREHPRQFTAVDPSYGRSL